MAFIKKTNTEFQWRSSKNDINTLNKLFFYPNGDNVFCSRGLNFIKPWQIPTDRLEDVMGLIRPWEKATHQRNIYHRNLPLSEPRGK